MGLPMLTRIADGRTDLVFDYLAAGHPADTADAAGVSLLRWCAYYGDVSAIRFLLSQGERLESLGPNLGLDTAAFHGHWRLCEFQLEHGADANYADQNSGESNIVRSTVLISPLLTRNAFAIRSTSAGGGVSLTNRTASLVEINFAVAGLVASICSTRRPSCMPA